MLYRTMPKTGEELSILGFGAMRPPLRDDGSVDADKMVEQIRYSIDNGVNYIDTAFPYIGGQSETIVCSALKDGYRDKVKLATKLPQWEVETREDMDRFLNRQLAKLGVDYVDYYLIHNIDGASWAKLEAIGVKDFLDSALADGRIRYAGFSFHGIEKDFPGIIDSYDWTFCQIQYNFLDQNNQAGTAGLKYAASKGLGVVVMEPLRGGNLGNPVPPREVQEIWGKSAAKRTPVQWALEWIWNCPEVTLLLSGMNMDDHIDENLAIAAKAEVGCMSSEDMKLVDEAAAKYAELIKVDCTGCGYCVPCPVNVNIPFAFNLYNGFHMFNDERAKFQYAVMLRGTYNRNEGYASQCVGCGECVSKCPQGIPIPEKLKDVEAVMEGPHMVKMLEIFDQAAREDAR